MHASQTESRRECVVLFAKKGDEEKQNGVVQWREDGEVAAWSSRRRAMHPSFMIRHSEARKTYRVRRYMMTAQVRWVRVRQIVTERKDVDKTLKRLLYFYFGGIRKSLR